MDYLARHFSRVHIIAVRDKIFDDLSEDCWLLYAEGFGDSAQHFRFTPVGRHVGFAMRPPTQGMDVTLTEWRKWNSRLRPFLMPAESRATYEEVAALRTSVRLGAVARVGIGYVTGANDFFHLRPSEADALGIPEKLTHPTVRNGKALIGEAVTESTVRKWLLDDEPVLLLRLKKGQELPKAVRRYLDSDAGREARESYKCRTRDPWYVVPDVTVPDAFLSYMSGNGSALLANRAHCICTNSVHAVNLRGNLSSGELYRRWQDPVMRLSCEVEGHPLGGGMLKVEPREASRLLLAKRPRSAVDDRAINAGIKAMRKWRHYG